MMSLSSKKRMLKRPSEGAPNSPSHVTILARKKRQQAELAMKATEKVLLLSLCYYGYSKSFIESLLALARHICSLNA